VERNTLWKALPGAVWVGYKQRAREQSGYSYARRKTSKQSNRSTSTAYTSTIGGVERLTPRRSRELCAAKTRDCSQRPDPDSVPDCSAPSSQQPTSLEEHLYLAQAAHADLVRCDSHNRRNCTLCHRARTRVAAVSRDELNPPRRRTDTRPSSAAFASQVPVAAVVPVLRGRGHRWAIDLPHVLCRVQPFASRGMHTHLDQSGRLRFLRQPKRTTRSPTRRLFQQHSIRAPHPALLLKRRPKFTTRTMRRVPKGSHSDADRHRYFSFPAPRGLDADRASTSAAAAQRDFFGTPQLEMLRVLCQSMADDPSFSSDVSVVSTEASDARSHSHSHNSSEPERPLQAALAALLEPAQQFLVRQRTTLPSRAAVCGSNEWFNNEPRPNSPK